MGWDERQVRMLAEMGVRVWPQRPVGVNEADRSQDDGPEVAVASIDSPAEPPRTAPPVAMPSPPTAADRSQLAAPQDTGASGQVKGRAEIETLDWPALRAAVSGCRACSLCDSRRNTVFGAGHEQAHWMVVGEAPGEQEDREGEPFVGKAGQLLDQMLRSIGLSRGEAAARASDAATAAAAPVDPAQRVYIANVLKCRPPMNRNPQPEEVAQCEPFLRRQVALVQPKVILALGRFAVQSLLRTDEPIGRLRGRVHRYEGVPVIVSYHPAYLLRQPADKARAWDDLCLALETSLNPSTP